MKRIRLALLGCGNVGSGFVDLLERERTRIRSVHSLDITVDRILVLDRERERPRTIAGLVSTSAVEVLDGDSDVVVELIGGCHSAGAFVRRALHNGKHVVTANKALLAEQGSELLAVAARRGVELAFEASVCSGVPILRVLREGLAGDTIQSVRGIFNGTCNFILSRMETGFSFEDALTLAQSRGFAEADPALDVGGQDAAQKLRIVAAVAFSHPVVSESVVGITGISRDAIERARAGGSVIRLVGEARWSGGSVSLDVGPRELDAMDPLAGIREENNAVIIRARAAGEIVLTGAGAGAMPTAAAVLSDVIAVAKGGRGPAVAA